MFIISKDYNKYYAAFFGGYVFHVFNNIDMMRTYTK